MSNIWIVFPPYHPRLFSDFDVEGSWNCRYDFLEIRDGDNENSTLLGRYCGDSSLAPDLVTSSFNYLYLTFVTDGSVQNRGFILNYTTIQVFVLSACLGLNSFHCSRPVAGREEF